MKRKVFDVEKWDELRNLFMDNCNEEEKIAYLQLMKHDMTEEAKDYMLKVLKN